MTTVAQPPRKVFAAVADLDTYPGWFAIVDRVVGVPADEPTWDVDLVARIGPLKRTKRVRMVRVHADDGDGDADDGDGDGAGRVRYERQEADGRDHSEWVLEAGVAPAAGGATELRIHLHYGGRGWVPGLDLFLGQEARRAGSRLDALLRGAGS